MQKTESKNKYSIHVHWAIQQMLPYPLSIFTQFIPNAFSFCVIRFDFTRMRYCFSSLLFWQCSYRLIYSQIHSFMSIFIYYSSLSKAMLALVIEHVFLIRHHHRSSYVCEVFFLLYLRVLLDGSKWGKQMDENTMQTSIGPFFLALGKLKKSILMLFYENNMRKEALHNIRYHQRICSTKHNNTWMEMFGLAVAANAHWVILCETHVTWRKKKNGLIFHWNMHTHQYRQASTIHRDRQRQRLIQIFKAQRICFDQRYDVKPAITTTTNTKRADNFFIQFSMFSRAFLSCIESGTVTEHYHFHPWVEKRWIELLCLWKMRVKFVRCCVLYWINYYIRETCVYITAATLSSFQMTKRERMIWWWCAHQTLNQYLKRRISVYT